MNFLGIALRKPSFGEITAAAVLAVGCWMAAVGLAKASGHALGPVDAGALLLVSTWATVGVRLGLRFDKGPRHLAVYGVVGSFLLGVYQGALAIAL